MAGRVDQNEHERGMGDAAVEGAARAACGSHVQGRECRQCVEQTRWQAEQLVFLKVPTISSKRRGRLSVRRVRRRMRNAGEQRMDVVQVAKSRQLVQSPRRQTEQLVLPKVPATGRPVIRGESVYRVWS